MVVRPQMPCGTDENIDETSSSSSVFAHAANGAESVWEQWKIRLDIACRCGAKQTAKHKADCQTPTSCTLALDSNVMSLRTEKIRQNTSGWRIQPLNV